MSYRDGWDRWRVLENYIVNGNDTLEKFNEFMKRQAELELEYSNGMSKLIKQFKDDMEKKELDKVFGNYNIAAQKTSVNVAWNYLLDSMEKISHIHSELSLNLDTNLRKTVKYRARDNLMAIKSRFDEIRKSGLEVTKGFDLVEKARLKTLKTFKDLDSSHISLLEKKKDEEKLKLDFDKKLNYSIDAITGYTNIVQESSTRQNNHFDSFLLDTLSKIQKEDEQLRIMFIKSSMEKYNEICLDAYSKILEANQDMSKVFGNVSVAFDSDFFSKILKSRLEPMNDLRMFEILVNFIF